MILTGNEDLRVVKTIEGIKAAFEKLICEKYYERITCGGAYQSIRDEMTNKVNDEGWSKSKKYQKLSDYEKRLLMDFVNNAVLTSYRQWVEDGKKLPAEEVIEMTNRIVLGGVRGFFK